MAWSQNIDIDQAINENIVSYKIYGRWDSKSRKNNIDADGQYFGKCMTLEVRSKLDSSFYLSIRNGLMLISEDTSTQDMIITKPIYVKMLPGKLIVFDFYAMCSEYNDGMPHRLVNYSFGQMADSNLQAIVKVIDDNFMHNLVGQGAVWAYTDSVSRTDLIKYGATSESIRLTKEILNTANISTKLNHNNTLDTLITNADIEGMPSRSDVNYISINAKYFFTGLIGLIILFASTAFLLIILFYKKKQQINS